MHLEALYWVVSDNTNDSLFKYISIKYYNTDFMAFTCVLDVSIVGIGIGLVAARPSCSNIFSKLLFAKQQWVNSYHAEQRFQFQWNGLNVVSTWGKQAPDTTSKQV